MLLYPPQTLFVGGILFSHCPFSLLSLLLNLAMLSLYLCTSDKSRYFFFNFGSEVE